MFEPNDPTASATVYPARPVGVTRLSINEIEGLCLKAARGAGFGWGLAEEAGYAAGWLAGHGIDGAAMVLARLQLTDAPVTALEAGLWRGDQGRALCPIALGAALDDHAGLSGIETVTGPVAVPVLVVPFLARAAKALGLGVVLDWDGGSLTIGPQVVGLQQLAKLGVSELRISAGLQQQAQSVEVPGVGAETLAALNSYAMRITVPASASSRQGAGAASSDND